MNPEDIARLAEIVDRYDLQEVYATIRQLNDDPNASTEDILKFPGARAR